MKRLLALLISLLMIFASTQVLALDFAGTVEMPRLATINATTYPDTIGTSSKQEFNSAQIVAENDKYIFVAIGIKNHNFRDCSAVQIFEKGTNTLLKTIAMVTTNAAWHCPVREMFVDGDTLYISWANAVTNVSAIALRATSSGYQAPLYAYDVSDVKADEPLKSVTVDSGNVFRQEHLPYTLGGLAYLDRENGNLYSSKVSAKTGAVPTARTYVVTETSSIDGKLKDAETALVKKSFYTTGLSLNAAHFMYKDGWLFEVLQDNAGLSDITATDSLVSTATGENGEEIKTVHNNMIYVYDLRNVELTDTAKDVTNCLRGVYETQKTGDAVIRDIEVIGDTIYASTADGIEVIPFGSAKAEGLTEAVELTKNQTILTGKGGAADLDAVGNYLYAAFTGSEYFAMPNNSATGSPSPGEIVIYDIGKAADGSVVAGRSDVTFGAYDLSVNTNDGVIYVMNDTQGPPSMTAVEIEITAPVFNSGFATGKEVTENVPDLTGVSNGSSSGTAIAGASWAATKGQLIAESDKYIFVVMSKSDFNASGVVEIRDKKDGSIVAQLAEGTGNVLRWRSVREIYVHDEILYVSWGTAWNDGYAAAYGNTDGSPTMAYNVANLTKGVAPTGLIVNAAGKKAATHAPFIRGNACYLDKENDKLYIASVENSTYSYLTYYIYDTNAIKTAVLAGNTTGPAATKFTTGALSKNTVEFIVKDGWLYELLKSKAGLYAHTADETLVDDEGNVLNNMVRVYDISGKTPTSTSASYVDCLRGVYMTETAGQDVLREIEVYGDTLYVSNVQGIDVVPLANAKKAGVTAETKATLTKSKTLTGKGGAADMDLVGSYLAAAFTGTEYFAGPNGNSSEGEVIIYDLAAAQDGSVVEGRQAVKYGAYDLALNEKEGIMYVLNDTQGTPNMAEYTFSTPSIKFTEDGTVSYAPSQGVYDVSVKLTNSDSVSGTIICALYEGNRLSGVAVKKGTFAGEVTIAEDLEISDNVTKVKVMYLSDANTSITPLCEYVYAGE